MLDKYLMILYGTKDVDIIFSAWMIMFLLGFIYGYAVIFIFRLRKAIIISTVAVILTGFLIFLYTSGQFLFQTCFQTIYSTCSELFTASSVLPVWLMLLISHLLANILVGGIGILIGMLLYSPSGFVLYKFFNISFTKEPEEESYNTPERFDSYKSSILYNKDTKQPDVKPNLKTGESEFIRTSVLNKPRD